MTPQGTKRRRTDDLGNSASSSKSKARFDAEKAMAGLPLGVLQEIISAALERHPDTADIVKRHVDKLHAANAAKVIEFDHHSKTVWKAINVDYKKMSGSHQHDMVPNVLETIVDCIRDIQDNCPWSASYETKKNALETLRKIGKTMCLSSNIIASEVRKSFQYDIILEETMMDIADRMTIKEKRGLSREFQDKLEELIKLSKKHDLFEELSTIKDILWDDPMGANNHYDDIEEEDEEEEGEEDE